ncbi:hypothetical protein P3T36_006626 [Kitasatospora sp. MAP12-15]|nr:hypothetical protein [Kitasatospora sp. MAP12-44]MDH6115432.1 hypothetical protein [Kitasatospora sp. MAP12-44]
MTTENHGVRIPEPDPPANCMPHTRKCRCAQLRYANSMHVDIVSHLFLEDSREVIVNRGENRWEHTDPVGFTARMREKDHIADDNLRKVIRLMEFLRDHKNSFIGTRPPGAPGRRRRAGDPDQRREALAGARRAGRRELGAEPGGRRPRRGAAGHCAATG